MLDLDMPAVVDWVRKQDPAIENLPLEGFVDADPAVLGLMRRLGAALDMAKGKDSARLSRQLRDPVVAAQLCAVLAQAGTARRLRTLGWVTEGGVPDQEAVLAALLQAGPDGDFLRAELQALHRRAVLARIYGADRLVVLLNACQGNDEQGELS